MPDMLSNKIVETMMLFKVYQYIDETLLIDYAVAKSEMEIMDNYPSIKKIEVITREVTILENL